MGVTSAAAKIARVARVAVIALSCAAAVAGGHRNALAAEAEPPEDPPAASPMDPDAKVHYDRGLRLYADRDFAGAVRELDLGFAIDPRREFLFAQAQALRLAGACDRAVPLYRRFLDTNPSALQVEAARMGVDRCAPERSTTAAPRSAAPPSPPPRATSPAQPATPAPAAAPTVWWHDTWAAVAVGAGIGGLALGAAFEIASRRARDEAMSPATQNYSVFTRLWESAEQRRVAALTSCAVGAALLAAGSLRWLILHRRERGGSPQSAGAIVIPLRDGAALGWGMAF